MKLRPNLLALITLALALALGASVLAEAEPATLKSSPLVIERETQPLSAQALQYLSKDGSQTGRVWVFFTDKGVLDQASFDARAAEVTLTDKVIARRKKTGKQAIVFADLPPVPNYIDQVVSLGGKLRRVSRWLNAASFELSLNRLDAIASLQFVARIEPMLTFKRENATVQLSRHESMEPSVASPDALNYGPSQGQLDQINVPVVHDQGLHGEGVTLAIFDTGYRKSHEAFANHYSEGRVLAEWDFVFDDGETANEPEDWTSQWNHGTLIWSTSGGLADGHVYGPAYKANFLLAKTEDVRSETQVEEDNWVAALEWADTLGADVITTSLGYSDWYTYEDMDGATATTTIAANTCASLGIVLCNSMGNSGPSAGTLSAPADAHNILACGAVYSSGTIASFSSRGPTYEGRTKPEVCAQGVATACATSTSDNSYGTASGTSLSTPLVAGVACLMVQAHPEFPPELIRQAMMETADNAATPNNTYGWGIIDALASTGWGADFTADVQVGTIPLSVQFSTSTTLSPTAWVWDFGNGDSSFFENPLYIYHATGAYDVSLTITTSYGDITTTKQQFILAHADTLTFVPDSAYAGNPLAIPILLTNTSPLQSITIPFDLGADYDMTFDSVQFGARTAYFEGQSWDLWDPANLRYAITLTANTGGGAPPLTVGSGEVLRLFVTPDPLALGAQSTSVDTTSGSVNVALFTGMVSYAPEVVPGSATIRYVLRADVNTNMFGPNIQDLTYLVAYLFSDGTPPAAIQAGDTNADLEVNVQDLTYLVAYLFSGGPPPPLP